ncbi:hypothetical protein COE03_15610 [Bacillus thuringiensis]|nr:hypothetical protein COE03_15610 [Bacillus thuringiensis]
MSCAILGAPLLYQILCFLSIEKKEIEWRQHRFDRYGVHLVPVFVYIFLLSSRFFVSICQKTNVRLKKKNRENPDVASFCCQDHSLYNKRRLG